MRAFGSSQLGSGRRWRHVPGRRRRRIGLAMGAALLLASTAPPVGATAAPGPLVRGTLRDASGHPTGGVVALYAVHVDEGRLWFEPLAEQVVGADGTIRLAPRAAAAARVRELAGGAAGSVNVAIAAVARGGQAIRFATLRDPVPATGASQARRISLRADRGLRPGDRRRAAAVRVRSRSRAGSRVAGYHPTWCAYELAEVVDRPTIVGEMHVIPGVTQTFTYAQGDVADTEISVAVNPAGGDGAFTIAGSVRVTTQEVVGISRTRSGTYGRVLRSSFRYGRFHKPGTMFPLDCLVADDDIIVAVGWNGGWYEGKDVSARDGACTAGPTSSPYESGDTFTRSSEVLRTWGAAVKVFGVTLKARSGASERVTIRYEFGGPPGSRYQLCGSDGTPATATRIYVDDDWS